MSCAGLVPASVTVVYLRPGLTAALDLARPGLVLRREGDAARHGLARHDALVAIVLLSGMASLTALLWQMGTVWGFGCDCIPPPPASLQVNGLRVRLSGRGRHKLWHVFVTAADGRSRFRRSKALGLQTVQRTGSHTPPP
jgi:hypothetical protein